MIDATNIGTKVSYFDRNTNVTLFCGICEYFKGEWVGIRQRDGRLDEVPVFCVRESAY